MTVGAPDGWAAVISRMLWGKIILMHNAHSKQPVESTHDWSDSQRQKYLAFVELVQFTESVDGDLGLDWPTPDSPIDDLWSAYQALPQAIDEQALYAWWQAVAEVERGPGEEALKPDVAPGN